MMHSLSKHWWVYTGRKGGSSSSADVDGRRDILMQDEAAERPATGSLLSVGSVINCARMDRDRED